VLFQKSSLIQKRFKMIALVDCNNFYASCERVFNPAILRKPVIVLSNNDGCAIARSEEAKALGITMGMPAHMLAEIIKDHAVEVFSSNYTLYGDMSERVQQILGEFSAAIELYSIDEAFLDFSVVKPPALELTAKTLKERITQFTGIPVSVGIAPTKTLAKLANRFAKKHKRGCGIHCLQSKQEIDAALAATPVRDVWGIGKQQEQFLLKHNITTAKDLARCNENFIRKNFSVTGERLLSELKGVPSIRWEDAPPAKKEICTSRSFGKTLSDKKDIEEAIANHASNVSLKLRKQCSCARVLKVFIQTNPFRVEEKQYFRSVQLELPVASNMANELISYALKGLNIIFSKGYNYLKAGVTVSEIVPESAVQRGLFEHGKRAANERLMKTLDAANKTFGKDMLRFASQGYEKKWKLKACHLSPRYTTNVEELLTIRI
jgi:DNA polymerase V